MNDEGKTIVATLATICVTILLMIVLTRGCVEATNRKVRIEFMPEDAPKVKEIFKEIK